jgi:hypothetical protein
MKRDMDLIRAILLNIESSKEEDLIGRRFTVDEYEDVLVARHVQLLIEAGLVEGSLISPQQAGVVAAYARRLTWDGHEFLDAARHDKIWNRAKKFIASQGGAVPFEVTKAILIQLIKESLGSNDPT